MNTLTAEDVLVLNLALDVLSKRTDAEIAKARWQGSQAKKLTLLTMRRQIFTTRNKLGSMRGEA